MFFQPTYTLTPLMMRQLVAIERTVGFLLAEALVLPEEDDY